MKYKVNIEEILSRVIEVETEDEEKAEDIVKEMYYSEKVVLNTDDFNNVEFYIQ